MAIKLHSYNIVRVKDGDNIINCTVVKMFKDYAQIKLEGKLFRVPYHMMDKVVGHELLMPEE
jgi:sRNA-binding protein